MEERRPPSGVLPRPHPPAVPVGQLADAPGGSNDPGTTPGWSRRRRCHPLRRRSTPGGDAMTRKYSRPYSACRTKVNGSSPPVSFLDELVDWALTAADEIFAETATADIYASVVGELGPYESPVH